MIQLTRRIIVIVTLATGALSTAVSASGSTSFGKGPGSVEKAYNQGKQLTHQKLLCADCPLAGQTLDQKLAQRILSEDPLTAGLPDDERTAVGVYLSRRFGL